MVFRVKDYCYRNKDVLCLSVMFGSAGIVAYMCGKYHTHYNKNVRYDKNYPYKNGLVELEIKSNISSDYKSDKDLVEEIFSPNNIDRMVVDGSTKYHRNHHKITAHIPPYDKNINCVNLDIKTSASNLKQLTGKNIHKVNTNIWNILDHNDVKVLAKDLCKESNLNDHLHKYPIGTPRKTYLVIDPVGYGSSIISALFDKLNSKSV